MAKGGWKVLAVMSVAQFLMVLDQAVMNVSISQLVDDFDTEVTTIQAVITLYSLVMAALMIAGGKVGDLLGRRRAFGIGNVVYGAGTLLTAVSWSVPVLAFGWSVLEGIGAALVLPALAALTARTYRALAYGVLGGVAGAGTQSARSWAGGPRRICRGGSSSRASSSSWSGSSSHCA